MTSPSVVIVGPRSQVFCQSLAEAFESLGWAPRTMTWAGVPWSPKFRLGWLLGGSYDRATVEAECFNRLIRDELVPALLREAPDLVVVLKAFRPDDANMLRLRSANFPVVSWAIDSLVRYPEQQSLVSVAARAYLIDGGETSPPKAPWLPLGFDHNIFGPSQESMLFDVLFLGNISGTYYATRRAFLKRLRSSPLGRRWRVGFLGSAGSWLEDHVGRMPGNITWVGHSVSMASVADTVARSRVCINIHQDDGKMPVNPMFFAIPACGACQVAEDRPYLDKWLSAGKEYVPVNIEDFLPTIERLLDDDDYRRGIAAAGLQASQQHTFRRRAQQILDDVGLSSRAGSH